MGFIVRSRKVEGKEAKTRKQLQKCRQFDGTFVHVKQFSNWFYFRIGGKPDFFNAFSGAFWIWKCNILRVSQKTLKMLELFVLHAVLLALLMIGTYDCCTFDVCNKSNAENLKHI